ncbi:MAG: hypothetical protein JWM83_1916 [Candidatus Angelobacter sp.]|nr:hypothetical protein [Candidatus Angelobacter sp.]
MPSRQNPLYRLLHTDFHETFDKYVPQKQEWYDHVTARAPEGWTVYRKGIWFHCSSPANSMPQQGWKIHISATPHSARQVLDRALDVLFRREDADFKFALDLRTLFLMNAKNWSRGASGKFMTIYPRDNQRFLDLIEELHKATAGCCGPYILSDHRYRDSHVVFYRYGGMKLYDVLRVTGERTPMLVSPDGVEIPDQRLPYPVVPPWATPPLPANEVPQAGGTCSLKGSQYRIDSVLSFSNAGGIYIGLDHKTGTKVVIKEARPYVDATSDGYSAVEALKKEYRLLVVMAQTGIAPKPIDLFQEWEHWFLVEEWIEGMPMSIHSATHNVLLRTRPEPEQYEQWSGTVRGLFTGLIRIIAILHEKNIVFGDLSLENLIVSAGKDELRIIDFEGAYQPGVDRPPTIYTPGFSSEKRLAGCAPGFEDDYYSIGAVMSGYLFPLNGLFHLQPQAKPAILGAIQNDARLPHSITRLVLALMDSDPGRRPEPAKALTMLQTEPSAGPVRCLPVLCNYAAVVDGILLHIKEHASYDRRDRLFPADPRVFTTNPLSLAYGSAGVAYALQQTGKECPGQVIDWMLAHKITQENYPPGLYMGLSGIAWVLHHLGAIEEAEQIFSLSFTHPLLDQATDVFHGIAGWGLTSLYFFLETGDELYLDKAREAGEQLLANSKRDQRGCFWPSGDHVQIGFAHGASGISVFFLYLFLATRDSRFLATACDGLDFDLGFAVPTKDGGVSWTAKSQSSLPLYPYWRFGSAGVGSAVLRFYKVLGDEKYGSMLARIFIDTDRKYAVFPGRFMGLVGLGDFLMDMYDFTGEHQYLASARRVGEGLMQLKVERSGIAFPGDWISRLCCDYGTGSAGVALFFSRLAGRRKSDFMLDRLLNPNLAETPIRLHCDTENSLATAS